MKKLGLAIVVMMVVAVVGSVFWGKRTSVSLFPKTYSLTVADEWEDEQPWVESGGVWSSEMPKLTSKLNSEEFLAELKRKLPQHSVVSEWTRENTDFKPMMLGPGGELLVICDVQIHVVRPWPQILVQGGGEEAEGTDQLKQDLQDALREIIKRFRS